MSDAFEVDFDFVSGSSQFSNWRATEFEGEINSKAKQKVKVKSVGQECPTHMGIMTTRAFIMMDYGCHD